MSITGICKDCGNGTLNGELNPQFHIHEGKYNDVILCNRCDSSHIEVTVTDPDQDEFMNRYGMENE